MFVSLKTFGVLAVVQCLVLAVPFPGYVYLPLPCPSILALSLQGVHEAGVP
jgi:hypothetical protein